MSTGPRQSGFCGKRTARRPTRSQEALRLWLFWPRGANLDDLGGILMTAVKKRRAKKRATSKRWIASVKTVSTFPPEGLFTKSAPVIARMLASKKVSPKGPVSGLRMLTFFINRAGRGLSPSRRAELERAKALLSERIHKKNPNGKRRSA